MNNLTVVEKYSLCALKEIKSFNNVQFSIHLITSMLLEMMLDDNLEIIERDKKSLFGSEYKIILNAKAPNNSYNRIVYNYIKDMNKMEYDLFDIIMQIHHGSGFSDKKYREIVSALKEEMVVKGLISLEEKRGLFGKREKLVINNEKFDLVVDEVKAEFIDKDNSSDKTLLLGSLLNSINFLKNIVNKYEKDDLKNRINQIKDTDISKKVKVAREVIAIITSASS